MSNFGLIDFNEDEKKQLKCHKDKIKKIQSNSKIIKKEKTLP